MKYTGSLIMLIFLVVVTVNTAQSQDCIDYHLNSCPRINPNPYTVVPEGSQSLLLKRGEAMEVIFYIYQGRDYRISLCSPMYDGEVELVIYDMEDQSLLLYDNKLNDMAQVFEFQVFNNRRVRAKVTVPLKDETKKQTGLLVEKAPRDCVGILLESMVTRK